MKSLLKVITIMIVVLIFSINTFALNTAPSNVTEKAKATIGDFTNALESQKQGYGIQENEVVKNNITLGEGYEVNNISDTVLKAEGTTSNDELVKNSNVYAFPIKLGSKCVGIALVDSTGVLQISSYIAFESDIENAKKVVKKELKKDDLSGDNSVKFIYDTRVGFSGLSMKTASGDYLVPLKDAPFEDLKKGVKKPAKEASIIFKKIMDSKTSAPGTFAGAGGSTTDINRNQLTSSFNYLYVIIPILFVILLIGLYMNKKKAINE